MTASDEGLLRSIDAYWRAANYLSVGQIYLLDNPLLREPLRLEHIKPRLLGHWGTSPGLNFVYAHMNRVITTHDLEAMYVIGPGHGGPAIVANAWLEGTYSEVYPQISRDEAGMRRLFRQFSFPGGIPSHVAPETPGSIHEGGELGYALAHAYGAAFDNPDLLVCCVVGDGEAETGPLAASWHSNKFLDPVRDGAVLPILHLNGYKIANPTILARIPADELVRLLEGYGHRPIVVEGHDPAVDAPPDGRRSGRGRRPDPAGPARRPHERSRAASRVADDRPAHAQGLDRAGTGGRGAGRGHVPLPSGAPRRSSPSARTTSRILESWMRSYRPEELFDETGAPVPRAARAAPAGGAADERHPARQRGAPAAAPDDARLPRARRRGPRAGGEPAPRRRGCWGASSATSCGSTRTGATSACSGRTRSPPTG